MNEEMTIKRPWVKKAAIIFFIVMLILTFFSNTIMNYSLPMVSVQYIKEGQISTTIRGSGTVEAIGNYEVMINQSRKINSVLVQPGDTVNVGDALFSLEDKESDELKMARDTLDDLNLQYQKMLINLLSVDYTGENRNIERVRQSLEESITKREENKASKQQVDNAELALNIEKHKVSELTEELNELQTELNDYSGATDESLRSLKRQIDDKERQIDDADSARVSNPVSLSSLKLELKRLREDYDLLIAKYPDYDSVSTELQDSKVQLQNAEKELSDAEKNNAADDVLNPLKEKVASLRNEVNELKNKLSSYSELTSLLRRIDDKEYEIENYEPYLEGPSVDVEQLEIELERLEDDYEDMRDKNKDYERLNKKIENKKDDLSETNDLLETMQKTYDNLVTKHEEWKAADKEAATLQNNLEDLLFGFEQKKEEDEKTSAISNLDFEKLKKDIDEQKSLIDEMEADAVDGKVVADQAGIIKSINISAGGTTAPNMTIAVIEVSGRGYSLSFSTTKEQSEKVAVGDEAKVEENNVSATLKQIKNDFTNPGENKILTFLLEGEVESGDIYSLSVTKESRDYDFIIPSSALHSDSNGYFVLTVTSKRTPFGSRYMTKRVSVEVLAEDDQNVAVSGNIRQGEYVITTSTKLLEPGMQIRMANE